MRRQRLVKRRRTPKKLCKVSFAFMLLQVNDLSCYQLPIYASARRQLSAALNGMIMNGPMHLTQCVRALVELKKPFSEHMADVMISLCSLSGHTKPTY